MNISLKQGYDMFIFDRETYCKEKTIQTYKNTLSYFFKFMEQDRGCSISEIPLDSVSTMDVKKYVVSLRSKNKLEDHRPAAHLHGVVPLARIKILHFLI